ADIYAVGGILYRALTGKKPFDSDDPSATLTQVLTEDPERPRSLEPSIPQALELVLQRAMEKKPANRYQSMAEFEADLVPFDPDPTMIVSEGSSDTTMVSPAAGAADKVEGGAQTVLVGSATRPAGSQTNLMRATRDARLARPTIVGLTALAYVWVLAS